MRRFLELPLQILIGQIGKYLLIVLFVIKLGNSGVLVVILNNLNLLNYVHKPTMYGAPSYIITSHWLCTFYRSFFIDIFTFWFCFLIFYYYNITTLQNEQVLKIFGVKTVAQSTHAFLVLTRCDKARVREKGGFAFVAAKAGTRQPVSIPTVRAVFVA